MNIIGLTGGIGSGKSMAADCFRERHIPVVDADGIGHDLLAGDPEVRVALRRLFGEVVFADDMVSRDKLGELVFHNDDARREVNALLHPRIMRDIMERCAHYAARSYSTVMIEAALLCEDGQREPWLNGLVLVLAPAETRIARLCLHRGMSREEAEARITAQQPPERKVAIADWIIDNGGDVKSLREQTLVIAGVLHGLSG